MPRPTTWTPHRALHAIGLASLALPGAPAALAVVDGASLHDRRAQDWRNGAVVDQIIVGRFDTNHKHDALDDCQISPEFGRHDDFRRLGEAVHAAGMKRALDGVFNHVGRNAPRFQDAAANPASPWRGWSAIGPQHAGGARVGSGFQNLPELNLENPAVQHDLWGGLASAVRSWLREGADGWRLDTASELGPQKLAALTAAAHAEKADTLAVGEIVNQPGEWLSALDGVMGLSLRQVILGAIDGRIAPARAGRMIDRITRSAGIEGMLQPWSVIDKHGGPRLATQLPDAAQRQPAQVLQFTWPGSPKVCCGAALGMTGGPAPENRGPMGWDLVRDDNADLQWMRRLIALHHAKHTLRVGGLRCAECDKLLACERYADRALDTVLVFANPTAVPVTERVLVANAMLMDDIPLADLHAAPGAAPMATIGAGFVPVTAPARSVRVRAPRERALGGDSRYKGVR